MMNIPFDRGNTATITIRNVPDQLVDRIKRLAEQKGVSMEQEIRDLLQRYVQRGAALDRIRRRWLGHSARANR
jgi:predicted transcriptional regulator